jgi:hypothetical protein
MLKIGDTCKKGHLITQENSMKNGLGGRWVACKTCKRLRSAGHYEENKAQYIKKGVVWKQENPDKLRLSNRRHRLKVQYRLTVEGFERMLAKQGGKCGNSSCGAVEPGGRHNVWIVDHDHSTKCLRGLLCNGCNVALGMLKEDEQRILGLIKYLRRYKGETKCSDVQTGQLSELTQSR